MIDPYLYENTSVLRNSLGIKVAEELEEAEANITYIKLIDIDVVMQNKKFDTERLQAIHHYIFSDIYTWAGKIRTVYIEKPEEILGGDTIRYSSLENIFKELNDVMIELNMINWRVLSIHEVTKKFSFLLAKLWKIHPFREGNTRTTITFATQFGEAHGFKMDKLLFKEHASYVRNALVKATDGQYAELNYLENLINDAILRG